MKDKQINAVGFPKEQAVIGRSDRANDSLVVEISCTQVLRELSNYIDQDTDPELRAQIEGHFPKCRRCTATYDAVRNIIRLVGDGRTFELPAGFSERLHKKLAKRLRGSKA